MPDTALPHETTTVEENVFQLKVSMGLMQGDLASIKKQLDEHAKQRDNERFGKKDVLNLFFAAVGALVIGGGALVTVLGFYVNSQIDPLKTAAAGIALANNSRFESQASAIQAIRLEQSRASEKLADVADKEQQRDNAMGLRLQALEYRVGERK